MTRTDAVATPRPVRYELNTGHVAWTTLVFFVGFGANSIRNAFGWYTWAAVILAIFAISIVWITRSRSWGVLARLPWPLYAFVGFALLSIAWSQWPLETMLGNAVIWLGLVIAIPFIRLISWDALLIGFSGALRWVVGLSILFELWVSLVIRHPILPVFVDWTNYRDASLQLLWSRNTLFVDGKIQGIVGNSSILAAVAAVGLIAIVVQLLARRMGRAWGIVWIVVMVGTLALTRSATIIIALGVVAVVLVAVLIRRRIRTFIPRIAFYLATVGVVVAAAIVVPLLWSRILALFGKSDDLTGRFEIWEHTLGLAVQRPVAGWGWLSYWPPWVEPLNSLNERHGVVQLHAHNAWIDLFLQVGIIGGVFFALAVLVTFVRSYRASITPVWNPITQTEKFSATALLPILLMVLLIVQSFTESRILYEEGFLTFVLLAVKLKTQPFAPRSWGATVRT